MKDLDDNVSYFKKPKKPKSGTSRSESDYLDKREGSQNSSGGRPHEKSATVFTPFDFRSTDVAKQSLKHVVTPAIASRHPFEVEARDHAETPLAAYADIEPFLFRLSQSLGKRKDQLIIYDPYFCEGSMVKHLNSLGFSNVINRNVDFYADWKDGTIPEYDVLVTNPPFSGNHMERILSYCETANKGRPYFLLLPQFVAKKGYYLEYLKRLDNTLPQNDNLDTSNADHDEPVRYTIPWFVGPKRKPYLFAAPGLDSSGAAPLVSNRTFESHAPVQIFAATFQCVWFVFMGSLHKEVMKWWWMKKKMSENPSCNAVLEANWKNLPQLQSVPKATPASRRWRKKLSRQHKNAAKNTS